MPVIILGTRPRLAGHGRASNPLQPGYWHRTN